MSTFHNLSDFLHVWVGRVEHGSFVGSSEEIIVTCISSLFLILAQILAIYRDIKCPAI